MIYPPLICKYCKGLFPPISKRNWFCCSGCYDKWDGLKNRSSTELFKLNKYDLGIYNEIHGVSQNDN